MFSAGQNPSIPLAFGLTSPFSSLLPLLFHGRECMRRRKSGYTTPFTWTTGIIILRRPLGGHGTGPSATINAIGRHSMTMGMDNVDDDGHLVATQIALSAGGGASISTLV